ncbi:MAG: farnesyl diphosphate synthase [Xanthomonadales bacterium]
MQAATEQQAEISTWQQHFESILDRFLPSANVNPGILHQAMRYSSLAGGKRFRPVLVYASGKALGLKMDRLDPLACAIELIHTYSLIHDDLPAMDDDDLRRGQPTCHRAYDEATAILAGDALQALAFRILADDIPAQAATNLSLIRELASACGSTGMAGGQAMDLGAVGNSISLAELETMHRLKTGALIQLAVTAPCHMADASEDTRNRFSAFGKCLGLAFQVHDDILDVTGDSALTGKSTQADAALNKPTFPSILGLEESQRRANALCDEAIASLEGFQGDTSALIWLADYVVSRDC